MDRTMSVTTLRTGGRLMYSGVTHGRDRVGRHSVDVLRVSMGLVILAFGLMKFFPGVSPAEDLVIATTGILTFDLVPPALALALTATLESVIGLSLVTGWGLRRVVYLLALWLAGILSPIVLLPGRLFSGPGHMPTLEGQYVLKDVILVGASIVIASTLPAPAPAHEDNTCC